MTIARLNRLVSEGAYTISRDNPTHSANIQGQRALRQDAMAATGLYRFEKHIQDVFWELAWRQFRDKGKPLNAVVKVLQQIARWNK